MAIHYTQASAGSGKTFSIEQEAAKRLVSGDLKPAELTAVTFTVKAADELKARITGELIKQGRTDLAANLSQARIGTINGVCSGLLKDFAFDVGLSLNQRVIDDVDKSKLIAEALDASLDEVETQTVDKLAQRLSVESWRLEVLDLIEKARLNNIDAHALMEFAYASAKSLQAILPDPDASVTETELRSLLSQAIVRANSETKRTKGLVDTTQEMNNILRQNVLTWDKWVKVRKFKVGVKEGGLVEEVMEFSSKLLSAPAFQEDLGQMIHSIFGAAIRVMKCFAKIKSDRGLVDFADQECLLLEGLKEASVSENIKPKLKFLIVDEFQDTSPLQLTLFSKLADLASDVLFVGDAKQAIYGFRGSDSKLSLDVLKYIEDGAGSVSTLNKSWRSRSGLVYFANALFTKPFSHLLKEEHVALTPALKYSLPNPELSSWRLEGRNEVLRTHALAYGVRAMFERKHKVRDKESKKVRDMTWRDVAVLCRSNQEIETLAEGFVKLGIPVASSRLGLLETPEGALGMACLRRLADPSDVLASAEILCLTMGNGPETWLASRFCAIDEGRGEEWADSACEALEMLAKARESLGRLSPTEAMITALQTANVLQTVVSWGEERRLTEHRLANVQHLVSLAEKYENACSTNCSAATVGGLILWLRQLEQNMDDGQVANAGDAVNLLTYHGSKGLEWPVVICSSLNKGPKVSLFGTHVLQSDTVFDWKNPLRGRTLRYWPNPFPNQRGSDPLTERLKSSEHWLAAEKSARDEALQLLYVGITRARDHLVITESGSALVGEWLSLLESPLLPLAEGEVKLPCGNEITANRVVLVSPENSIDDTTKRTRYWFSKGAIAVPKELPFSHAPSSALPIDGVNAAVVHDFGWRIPIIGDSNLSDIGDAIHSALALWLKDPRIDRAIVAQGIEQRCAGAIDPNKVHQRALELREWIEKTYPGSLMHTELPFSYRMENGQLVSGQIDLALERKDGWVLFDHKSNPQKKSMWTDLACKHSGQLLAYCEALKALDNIQVSACFIHMVLGGGIVQLSQPG